MEGLGKLFSLLPMLQKTTLEGARVLIQAVRIGQPDAAVAIALSTRPDVSVEVSPEYAKVIESAFRGARKDIERAAL